MRERKEGSSLRRKEKKKGKGETLGEGEGRIPLPVSAGCEKRTGVIITGEEKGGRVRPTRTRKKKKKIKDIRSAASRTE